MNTTGSYLLLALILVAGISFSVGKRKLTPTAAVLGAVIALTLFAGAGFTAVSMMTCFFIMGTIATTHKKGFKKQMAGAAEDGPRDTWQVWANSGMAALLALAALLLPDYRGTLIIMIAAAFATATGDTLSSELGMVYGRRFFNILSFKTDRCGLDGVISLEGLIIGLGGSAAIAIIYSIFQGWNYNLIIITSAGLAGNIADSVLGALLERKQRLGNNAVNFLATAAGTLTAWIMA